MHKLLLSLVFILASSSLSSADLLDVDSDGQNDVIVAERAGNTWFWSAYTSSSNFGSEIQLDSGFGGTKARPIPGAWDTANTFSAGTVKTKKKYSWRSSGNSGAQQLGNKNNTVLGGFDWDGNGITDFALVSKNGTVTIYQNFFTNAATTATLSFTKGLARKGYPLVVNNSGTNLYGFVKASGKGKRKKVTFQGKDAAGNSTTVELGRVKGSLLSAIGIVSTGSGLRNAANAILLVAKSGSTYQFISKALDGSTINSYSLRAKVRQYVVSDFTAAAGEEILIRTKKAVTIRPFLTTPTSDDILTLNLSEKILSEKFVIKAKSKTSTGNSGGNSGGGSLGSACSGGVRGLGSGVLWKPDSDVSDNRGGKPVVLFQGGNKPRTNSIAIYAKNGTRIGTFTFKNPDESGINGNSDHYYSGWVGGSGETGGQLANEATAAAGSPSVYFTGPGGSCFGPVHPDGRSGSLF